MQTENVTKDIGVGFSNELRERMEKEGIERSWFYKCLLFTSRHL